MHFIQQFAKVCHRQSFPLYGIPMTSEESHMNRDSLLGNAKQRKQIIFKAFYPSTLVLTVV